jgi:hypothetical protein
MTIPPIIQQIIDLNPPLFKVSCAKPRQVQSVMPFAGVDLFELPDLLTRETYLLSNIDTYQRKQVQLLATELRELCSAFVAEYDLQTSELAIVTLVSTPEKSKVVSKLTSNTEILKSEEAIIANWLAEKDVFLKDFFKRFVDLQEQVVIWRISLVTWSRSEGNFSLENELGNLSNEEFTELNKWVDSQVKQQEADTSDEDFENETDEVGKM